VSTWPPIERKDAMRWPTVELRGNHGHLVLIAAGVLHRGSLPARAYIRGECPDLHLEASLRLSGPDDIELVCTRSGDAEYSHFANPSYAREALDAWLGL